MENLDAAPPGSPKFVSDLDTLIRARYPLVYLVTWEEQRLDGILSDVAQTHGKSLFNWSITRGLRRQVGPRSVPVSEQTRDPLEAFSAISRLTEPSLVVMKDLHPHLEAPQVVRGLRELAEQLIKAAQGLTLSEAENAFAKAIANDGVLDKDDIRLVLEEKRQVVRKSGLLEFVNVEEDLRHVGGMGDLKRWLDNRSTAFGEAARGFGLPAPKGVLLLGVQGCGKSLTAKAIANQWALPLLRLDLGRIFSSFIGSSEENLRRAINVAESVAPTVLWLDEIEKGLSGSTGQVTDSGVSARVFGTLLTWLQEKTAPVFVVATCNRIDVLPPELLRKGRFDELFFIDLPSTAERREIFRIHLTQRRRDPLAFDLDALAVAAEGFSGSEIEQSIIAGLYSAFAENGQLSQAHLVRALGETFPISATMAEEITELREWAKRRTRPAS